MKQKNNIHSYNQIYTITTKGCESCLINERLIKEALSITKKKVDYTTQDFTQVDKNWLKQNNITDYPTTLLIKDDVIRFKYTGTRPSVVIARWIDVHL